MRRALTMASIPTLVLLLGAAGLSGCSSDSARVPDGGGVEAGGGAGGGGGGAGGGSGGAQTMNCANADDPIDPTGVIDDMETPDYMTVRAGGRNGAWWAGGDLASPNAIITPSGDAPAELIPGGRCGSRYAMH